MSKRIVAAWPAKPKTKEAGQIALCYAALLVVLAVSQLFSFETFPLLFEYTLFDGDIAAATVLAAVIVVLEVAAIPFLLRMRLSVLLRTISMVASWLVPAIWLTIAVWLAFNAPLASIGLMGSVIELPAGWWAVFFCAGLGMLAVWSSWGLWPYRTAPKHTSKSSKDS